MNKSLDTALLFISIAFVLPTILLYVRSFTLAFADSWIHRKERSLTTVGKLMNDIWETMDCDIIISSDFPFIIPIIAIFTLIVVIIIDFTKGLCYVFDRTLYRVIMTNTFQSIFRLFINYVIKIPIRYCIVIPFRKVKGIFECIKERIYNIHI